MDSDSSSSSSDEFQDAPQPQKSPVKPPSKPLVEKKNITLVEGFQEQYNLKTLDRTNLISENDEISLLQVPVSIDPYQLMDQTIKFNKRTKVRIGGKKYVSELCAQTTANVLLLQNNLQLLHPVSFLTLHRKLKDHVQGDVEQAESSKVPLPDNLKVRHPLFGPEYESSVQLNEEVKQKLTSAKIRKSKKEKKKKKLSNGAAETSGEDYIINLLENHNSSDSKKKNKQDNELRTPKRNKSFMNSTVVTNARTPAFNLDVSEITKNESVVNGTGKKVKIKRERGQKRNLSDEIKEEVNATPRKKVKQEIKDDDDIEEIMHNMSRKLSKKKIKKEIV